MKHNNGPHQKRGVVMNDCAISSKIVMTCIQTKAENAIMPSSSS